jgi:hypothetical protein
VLLNDAVKGRWQVYGKGVVTLYKGAASEVFTPGKTLDLDSSQDER